MHHRRSKPGKCRDDQADRRVDHDESRTPRLVPDPIVESVGNPGIVDDHGALRRIPHDGPSVGIDMVVPVAGIAMLAVRLGLLLEAALRINIGWSKTSHQDRGGQAGNQSHDGSPFAGRRIYPIRARLHDNATRASRLTTEVESRFHEVGIR
jgi:hypothetical protein